MGGIFYFTECETMNFLGLEPHYTDKYLHWRCTKEDAMELRYLYDKLSMRSDSESVDELVQIAVRQAEMRERDRMEGLL